MQAVHIWKIVALSCMYVFMDTVRWNRKRIIEILLINNKSGIYKLNGQYSCYRLGFLACLINRNWLEDRQGIPARLYWDLCCSTRERKKVTGSLACSLSRGRAGSLYGVRVGVGLGVGPEVWLRWPAHTLGGVVCRGLCACTVPCFCSWLLRSGSCVSVSCCS